MTVIKVEDVRGSDLFYCAPGLRRFFKRHNLNLRKFLDEGLPAELFPQDDIMVQAAIDAAAKRELREVEDGRQQ